MNKLLVIALVNSLIEKKFKAIHDIRGDRGSRGPRGFRGIRGEDGQPFSFEENRTEIKDLISNHINLIKKDISLKFENLTDQEKGELKLSFDDLSETDISQLRGPRGQRGKTGRSIEWADIEESVFSQVKDLYSKNIDELKLKFSDLTKEEKDTLRLRFNQLSELDKLEIKGEKGDRGSRGLRGQKGRQGEEGKQGEKGEQGIGLRGAIGLTGLTGAKGPQGLRGSDGQDGKDAPKIIQVKIKKVGKKIVFVFIFDNGEETETNKIDLPEISTIINQSIMASSGGGSGGELEFFSDGVSLGSFEKVDFLNAEVSVDPIDPTKLNVNTQTCIPVLDEGNIVTTCATEFNFIGAGVQVVPEQKIVNWDSLTNVDSMATYAGDPNKVEVLIDNVAASVATINDNTFTEIKQVTATEDLAKQIILEQTPTDNLKVIIDIVGGTSQVHGTDFIVFGNTLDWNGLGMETIIDEGDIIRINYVI